MRIGKRSSHPFVSSISSEFSGYYSCNIFSIMPFSILLSPFLLNTKIQKQVLAEEAIQPRNTRSCCKRKSKIICACISPSSSLSQTQIVTLMIRHEFMLFHYHHLFCLCSQNPPLQIRTSSHSILLSEVKTRILSLA